MRTIRLTKLKNDYLLLVPDSIVKLYSLKDGQIFNLEVKDSSNTHQMIFLTYATTLK
jgi:hypothetical protein